MAAHFFLPFSQVTVVFFCFPSTPVYTCCCCSLIPHSHINALASFLTGLALSNVIFHLPITNIFISPHPFCPLSSICHLPTLLPLETIFRGSVEMLAMWVLETVCLDSNPDSSTSECCGLQ